MSAEDNKIESILYKNNILQPVKGFIATVEEGSVSAGAKKINLTQVTVTKQIQALERELGFSLFDRTNRTNLKLTEVGKNFYEFAVNRLIKVESILKDFIEEKEEKNNNVIKIAGELNFLSNILPSCTRKLIKIEKFKNTKIELFNVSKEVGLEMLKNGEIDFAVYPEKEYNKNNYISIDIKKIKQLVYVLVVDKNHPLTKKSKITTEDLNGYPYLFLDKYNYYDPRESISGLMTSNVVCKNATWEILSSYIKDTLNMIFIYDDYYNKFLKYDKDIVAINLSNLLTTSYIAVFTRKSGLLKEQTKFIIEELMKDKEE